MQRILKQTARELLNAPAKWICRREFKSQSFCRFNERPIEYSFVFTKLGQIYPRSVLDVGTGTTALPHLMRSSGCLVTATDNIRDYWPSGVSNRHYFVLDDDITNTRISDTFDLITCISVLEHIQNPDAAVRNMFSLLKSGGHLILTFPYTEGSYLPNVYEFPGSSYGKDFAFVTQSYSRKELDRWLQMNQGAIVDQEYWQFWEGSYWTVGKQVIPPLRVTRDDKHQLTCIDIRKT